MIPFPSGTPGGYLFLLYSREEKVSQGCASTTSVGHLVGFSLVYSPAQRTSNFERPWSVARCTPEPWGWCAVRGISIPVQRQGRGRGFRDADPMPGRPQSHLAERGRKRHRMRCRPNQVAPPVLV